MNQQQDYEGEINLVDYIKVIYKHWKMIIALVFIGMAFAGTFSLLKPDMYEASATFFPMSVREYYSTTPEALTMKRRIDIEDLIISILGSRKMADRIIEQLSLKDTWKVKLMSDARDALKAASKITLERDGTIKLSVRIKSPELSAKIVNAYVDNLDYFNRQLDIGIQRNIVQVIDRAIGPEKRMPRGTIKNTLIAGVVTSMFAVFLTFFLEFLQKTDIKRRLKE